MSREDLKHIQPGEILVTPMTMPEYVPAMKLAAAIVTDEGGIICHAAISAREMEKPCIIGTRVATRCLDSGDWVEVNANKGIITIL
jgi:pyruvate,water dikinase